MKNKEEKKLIKLEKTRPILIIESRGCWLAFWGLALAMVIECMMGITGLKALLPELAVFLLLSVFLFVSLLRNGIWDESLKPKYRTNLILSLIAGVATGLLIFLIVFNHTSKKAESAAAGVFFVIITAVCVLGALMFSIMVFKKKNKDMQKEVKEERDETGSFSHYFEGEKEEGSDDVNSFKGEDIKEEPAEEKVPDENAVSGAMYEEVSQEEKEKTEE